MHVPSNIDRDEILATPSMVRMSITIGDNGREPIFIVRVNTLQSKYVLQQEKFKLTLVPISNNWLAYGFEIEDDADNPMLLWSLIERSSEIEALKRLSSNPRCAIAIFNETGANTAFVRAHCDFRDEPVEALSRHVVLHPDDDKLGPAEAISTFENIRSKEPTSLKSWMKGKVSPQEEWKLIEMRYVTSQLSAPMQSLADMDEGGQQEQLVEWIADGIIPENIHRSPQVKISDVNERELVDVIATSELTYFIFESKSLTILGAEVIPERQKLAKNVAKHIKKATKQLRGAIRHISDKKFIFDKESKLKIAIPESPGHAIIMVPDLGLVNEFNDPGAKLLKHFLETTGHTLHILDPSELLRVVQGALRFVELGKVSATADGFDYLLIKRFENAVENDMAAIEIVHRFDGDESRMGNGYIPDA